MNLLQTGTEKIISLLQSRKISCIELMPSCLDRIEKYEPHLECFISLEKREIL